MGAERAVGKLAVPNSQNEKENIYFAKFGEECKKVHFHIFPRKKISERYLKQFLDTKDLNDPQIFDWPGREYKVDEDCFS